MLLIFLNPIPAPPPTIFQKVLLNNLHVCEALLTSKICKCLKTDLTLCPILVYIVQLVYFEQLYMVQLVYIVQLVNIIQLVIIVQLFNIVQLLNIVELIVNIVRTKGRSFICTMYSDKTIIFYHPQII